MPEKQTTLLRFICFVAGCSAAAAFVLAGRVPESQARPGARLTVSTQPTTALGVTPAGSDFISTLDLQPGPSRGARGVVTVTNYTGTRLRVALRLRSERDALDRVLRIAAIAGDEHVFHGSLRAAGGWSRGGFALAPKQRRRVVLRAWLPAGSVEHRGRSADLTLEWRTRKAGS